MLDRKQQVKRHNFPTSYVMFLPNTVNIRQCLFKLHLKMSGSCCDSVKEQCSGDIPHEYICGCVPMPLELIPLLLARGGDLSNK